MCDDEWNDNVLLHAFQDAISKYQQMHGLSIMKKSVGGQGLEKGDGGLVDFQPANAEERGQDPDAEPRDLE